MARSKVTLTASTKAIDPTLSALFTSSAGPIKAPSTTRYSGLLPPKERKPAEPEESQAQSEEDDEDANEEDDESLSEIEGADYEEYAEAEETEDGGGEGEGEEAEGSSSEKEAPESAAEPSIQAKKERKRKRKDEHDDLEAKYMRKIAVEEEKEEKEERDARSGKRRKGEAGEAVDGTSTEAVEPDDDIPIIHESLRQKTEEDGDVDLDKANRTLFLGNISIEAITSAKAKKTLMSHISAPLEGLDSSTEPQKVESLRFRSTPFATGSMPKRAAYITKSVMDATTKSTNAYAVYSTPLAARTALKALNGTVVLDRHLRADSVAHPTPTAHRRCVFVGNLGFVDDETVINTTAEGETTTKKRTKVPSDIEEGLWRIFGSKAGKVESVRVPRDPKTRVGKGFAYVQFYDGNDVEAALLLNEKKFPPMLPRILRVSRAKDPRKTALAVERSTKSRPEANGGEGGPKSTKYKFKATPEQQSLAGRAGRLLGRSAAARQKQGLNGKGSKKPRIREARPTSNTEMKTPEQIVFEGRRASSTDGKPRDLKFGKSKKKSAVKPKGRGAKRAAEWRKKGPN